MKKFFDTKIKPVLKIVDKPWFYPIILLLVGLAAYGIIFSRPGFYWDDWETVYLYFQHSSALALRYYQGRPLSGLPNIIMFSFVKMTPFAWQFASLILRWLGILFIYYTLNAVWPNLAWQNKWIGVLLFVFPGYLDQPVAVCFSRHLATFFLFASSLFLTVLSIKNRKYFWLWMPISVLLGITQIFWMEYFVILEIIRPLLIWFTLRSQQETKKKATQKTLLYWLPFVIGLGCYIWWRIIYLPTTMSSDPNAPTLLYTILISPISVLSSLFVKVIQDIGHLLISIWVGTLTIDNFNVINSKIARISWLLGIAAAVLFYLYIRRSFNDERSAGDKSFYQMLVFGSVAFVAGAIPVWVTGRQIADGKWSDRFSLGPMLGAVILFIYILDWLFRTRNQKQWLFVILLASSISMQVYNSNNYRLDWINQQNLYWQLSWRIPKLKPGTAIIGSGTFTDKSSFYDGKYIVDLLFNKTTSETLHYGYFDVWHLPASSYQPKLPLIDGSFKGSTDQAIGMYFNGSNPNECVRILDPIYKNDPKFNQQISNIIPISNLNEITVGDGANVPNSDVFGMEPSHTWCYYFEKADLARQMQDWPTILKLGAEAKARGLDSNSGSEYLPFIEAYAQTGQWPQAYQMSLKALGNTAGLNSLLCNNWRRFASIAGGADKAAALAQAETAFCGTTTK
jgi:hypothetical protein